MSVRNVVLITADQLRGDSLGDVVPLIVHAPHLRSVALDGATFAKHYSVTAPCGPARTSLLTGTYPFVHGSGHAKAPFDNRRTNIALEARKRGVRPVLFGYTDTNVPPFYPDGAGIMPGFEVLLYFNLSEFGLSGWRAHLGTRGLCRAYQAFIGSDLTNVDPQSQFVAGYSTADGDTAYIADAAIEFIRHHPEEAFLLHVTFLRPHPPLVVPEEFLQLYRNLGLRRPRRRDTRAEEARQHPYLAYWLKQHERPGYFDRRLDAACFDDDALDRARIAYFGLVTEIDHHVGRIIGALKDAKLWEDTLFVFTSDHGEMLGDHWCLGKGGYFDASYHIPLIIRDPSAPQANRGRTISHFTESVDIAPTILEWLDGSSSASFSGFSLLPFLIDLNAESIRPFVYFEHDFRSLRSDGPEQALGIRPEQCRLQVIRDHSHKYVAFDGLPPLLFNLEVDPEEFTNLLDVDRKAPASSAHYAQALLIHRSSHNPS